MDVLGSDYIRTARAKGLSTGAVVLGHGLRNAALPVVTVVGLEVGSLLGGAILTEQVFSWPGLGRLTVEAIPNRDFPLVQAAVLFFAATSSWSTCSSTCPTRFSTRGCGLDRVTAAF